MAGQHSFPSISFGSAGLRACAVDLGAYARGSPENGGLGEDILLQDVLFVFSCICCVCNVE